MSTRSSRPRRRVSPEAPITRSLRDRGAAASTRAAEKSTATAAQKEEELGTEKVAEMWADFAAEHYEIVEQLPLELVRNSRLLRELDQESLVQQERLQARVREYIAHRLRLARKDPAGASVASPTREPEIKTEIETAPAAPTPAAEGSTDAPRATPLESCDRPVEAPAPLPAPAASGTSGPPLSSDAPPATTTPGPAEVLPTIPPPTSTSPAPGPSASAPSDTSGPKPDMHDDDDAAGSPDIDAAGSPDYTTPATYAVPDAVIPLSRQSSAELGAVENAVAFDDEEPEAVVPAPPAESSVPAVVETKETKEPKETKVPVPSRSRSPAPQTTPPSTMMLGDMAQLMRELVRNREEKVAIAIGAYNAIDRHIRALDSALGAYETSLGLGKKRTETEAELPPDIEIDPNEPRYCYCQNVSYGKMVGCDNEDCPYEWFHLACLGMSAAPTGSFLCDACKPGGTGRKATPTSTPKESRPRKKRR